MIKRIIACLAAVAFLATPALTASASDAPPKHKLYNQKGSAARIIGWEGQSCKGRSVTLPPGTSTSAQGFSYKTNRYSRYKIGYNGKYRQVNPNTCVSAPANSTYMSVFVYNGR